MVGDSTIDVREKGDRPGLLVFVGVVGWELANTAEREGDNSSRKPGDIERPEITPVA